MWRDGVRTLDPKVYQMITGVVAAQPPLADVAPAPGHVAIIAGDNLIMPPALAGPGFRPRRPSQVETS
jgi:hypothetical protein